MNKFYFLFISSDKFPPFRVDVKSLFCKEMADRGHRIDWLLQSMEVGGPSCQSLWGDGRVWIGRKSGFNSRFGVLLDQIYGFRNDLKLFQLARRNDYDFIQVKDKFLSALLAMIACRRNKTKFVYWLSFPFPESYIYRAKRGKGYSNFPVLDLFRGHLFGFLLYHIILPRADHVFVQSGRMKQDVSEKGILVNNITAVPMGVDLSDIPLENERGGTSQSDVKSIVYIGSLSKIRKIDFLVRVFHRVYEHYPEARLYLIGGESEGDIARLNNLVMAVGIQHAVKIEGFLPLETAWEYVRKADVCVSPLAPNPIFTPASPTKLIEYMAFSKPVIANDHPEQREVLEASGGGICVPYEETAFADAILELLKDSEKAVDMGQRGRRYVEQHRCYRVIADMVESKYYDLLSEFEE